MTSTKVVQLSTKQPVHSVVAKMALPFSGIVKKTKDGWVFVHENGETVPVYRLVPTRLLRKGDRISVTLEGPQGKWRIEGTVSPEKIRNGKTDWVLDLPGGKLPLWKLLSEAFVVEGLKVEVIIIRQ